MMFYVVSFSLIVFVLCDVFVFYECLVFFFVSVLRCYAVSVYLLLFASNFECMD